MTSSPSPNMSEGRRIIIAFIVAFAFLMQGTDSALLTIAIPTIARDLEVDPLLLHLPITAYLLSLAIFMPASGWCADRIGARAVFLSSLVVFTLGSGLSALAPNLELLVIARLFQGIGGAMMTPVGRLLVLRAFGPGRTLDAMTYLTLPVLVGPLAGPLLGAFIITVAPWRWIFVVNIPVCILTLGLTLAFVPRVSRRSTGPFDVRGFLLVGLSLVTFQLGIEQLAHPLSGAAGTLLTFAVSAASLATYVATFARGPNAALDLSLFANGAFATGVIAGGIGRIGLNAVSFLLPLLLQIGFGMDPLAAAALSALGALGSLAAKPMLAHTISRFGYPRTLIGVVLVACALQAVFGFVNAGIPLLVLGVLVVINGTTRTMHFNAVNSLTYAELSEDHLSRAVASAGVFQQLSMGLGVSLSAAILAMIVPQGAEPVVADFHAAFLIMAAIPLLSIPGLWLLELRRAAGPRPTPAE